VAHDVLVQILNIYVSQGNIAARLKCDKIVNDRSVANVIQNMPVKEFFTIGCKDMKRV